MKRLTAAAVKSLRKKGLHRVDDGLYLRIARDGGPGAWQLRLVVSGKRRYVNLGPYPGVSLVDAKQKAMTYRVAIAEGNDPLEEERREQTPTFKVASEKSFEVLSKKWISEKTRRNRQQTMARYVYPKIGQVRVDEIDRQMILEILLPLWSTRPEQGRRIRRHIREVLEWCLGHGFVEVNLAGEPISGALPSMRSLKKHYRTIPHEEVADAIANVRQSGAHPSTILCFELMILTATRSQECRLMVWDEVSLDDALWEIPSERTKTRKGFRVPLSTRAVEILHEARELFGDEGLIFKNARGRATSDSTASKLCRELGINGVPHALARATFRSWCADNSVAFEVAEAALNHVANEVVKSYQRSDLLVRRREVMQGWSDYLGEKQRAKVISIRGA